MYSLGPTTKKMEHKDFYLMSENYNRGSLNLIPKLHKELDINKLFRNEYVIDKTVEFIVNTGSKNFDMLNSGFPGVFLISKRLVDLLRKCNATGWDSIPTIIQGNEAIEYYLLTVTGRCSAIDYEMSESFLKAPFTTSGKSIEAKRGLYFDLKSWDGSDIFTPKESRFTFVTEKVKSLLLNSKVTNIAFENITKHEVY
ncbi:MAG: hypothetical protein FD170_670 [Bacteroidetes bacterium]|nr:MAG: hypothetical protein FD170_670 [Bacteroidota bacterium]